MQANIFIICGPSASGKGTVIKKLSHSLKFTIIPTYTTRQPSQRDKDNNYYRFISKNDFFKKLENKKFIESNFYDNNYYATLKSDFDNFIKNHKLTVKEQDISSALKLKQYYPNRVIVIYLFSNIEDLRSRLIKRNQNTQRQIENRLNQARKENQLSYQADFVVQNPQNFPENAVKEIQNIINQNYHEKKS